MSVYYNEAVDGPATYYQSPVSGSVIGVIDACKSRFFYYKSDNSRKELFNLNGDINKKNYVKIVPLKSGDVIYLRQNNINPQSPHAKKYFKVTKTEDFWASLEPIEDGSEVNIDIRNWIWKKTEPKKVSPEKPAIVINDGDIITKDGKQFKVTLTEIIPEQKFRIGDVIDNRIILEAEFKNNEWYYLVYDQSSKKNIELREMFIKF